MPTTPSTPYRILLCVTGLTPQIITETLYVLTQQRGERIDEVRVITTIGGRNRILSTLLNREDGKFFAFCRDYGIDPASIRFNETTIRLLNGMDGRTLEDIRSVEDNTAAANQICEIVRGLTSQPHTQLHASAAGGRKTMSIYLTTAMQLFGRVQDRLSHVLVNEDFEMQSDFFYIPPAPQTFTTERFGHVKHLSTADAEIHLADIPFIRLRGVQSAWLPGSGGSYSDLVRQAQEDLDLLDSVHELRLNTRQMTFLVTNRVIALSRREFLIYALMVYMREAGRGEHGFVQLDDITREDLDTVFRRITAARGREFGIEEYPYVAGFKFFETFIPQLASKKQEDREDLTKTLQETVSKINRKCSEQRLPERYWITTTGERGALRYGVRIPPEHIVWHLDPAIEERG